MRKSVLAFLLPVLMGLSLVSCAFAAETVVVRGTYDSIEKILDSLGWSYELIDSLEDYDLTGTKQLYINCGSDYSNATIEKVRTFVEAGGYLYSSDWASVYIEPWGLEFGYGGETGTTTATIEDPGLKSYLQQSTITIEYDLPAWHTIDKAGGASVLLRGDIETYAASVPAAPLAVIFGAGKGRVIYTTFHNEHGGITQPGMQKAVEYFAINPKTASAVDELLAKYGIPVGNLIGSSANSIGNAQTGGVAVEGVPAGTEGVYLFEVTGATLGVAPMQTRGAGESCEVELYKPGGTLYKTERLSGSSIAVPVPAADGDAGNWTFKVKDYSGYSSKAMVVAASCRGTTSGGDSATQVATPTASLAGGTYRSEITVSLACATPGAEIHFTFDGTTPTMDSPLYTRSLNISATNTLKAVAFKSGMTASNVLTRTYEILPCDDDHSWSDDSSSGCDAGAGAVGLLLTGALAVLRRRK